MEYKLELNNEQKGKYPEKCYRHMCKNCGGSHLCICRNTCFIAGLSNGSGYGHGVVIYGTQFVDNASGLKYYVDIIDPLTGGSRHLEFSSFCSGALYNLYYFETIV